jgi:hypothetical protein
LGERSAKARIKKIITLPPRLKEAFTHYPIQKLSTTVFDRTVNSNLQQFSRLALDEQAGPRGYDLVRRAYKSALSSQERNPKLPQPRFEEQKAVVSGILTRLSGAALGNSAPLE